MKKVIVAMMAMLMLLSIGIVGSAQANQILNGSFETPVITPTGVLNFGVGAEPTGFEWTVVTNSVDIVSNFHGRPSPNPGQVAYDGMQWLDLVGLGSTGAIKQTFATVAGQQYTLFFAYANNAFEIASASAAITITDGINTLLSQSITHSTSTQADINWTTFSQSFFATGTSATLLFNNTVGVPNGGIFLDAIDIAPTTVPLPGAVLLLGSGLLGLVGFRKKFMA